MGFPLSSLNALSRDASDQLIFDYIPYAIAGVIIVVFYVFIAVLIVRVSINVIRLTFFASKVVNRKIRIIQRREEYRRQLDELGIIYQNLSEQINDFTVLPADYKNLRATDSILRYFTNNRVDTVREAVNLFHDEDFKNRQLEYSKGMYSEARQTRRYTKALYMLTSDENIKVDVKDVRDESYSVENENAKVGEMLKDAFSKIKKSSPSKLPRLSQPNFSDSANKNPEEFQQQQTGSTSSRISDILQELNDLDIEPEENAENMADIGNIGEVEDINDIESIEAIEDAGEHPEIFENFENSEEFEESEYGGEENLNAIFDGASQSNNDEN